LVEENGLEVFRNNEKTKNLSEDRSQWEKTPVISPKVGRGWDLSGEGEI
jgi:hypothetical protein